jgi:hypothetical protein
MLDHLNQTLATPSPFMTGRLMSMIMSSKVEDEAEARTNADRPLLAVWVSTP